MPRFALRKQSIGLLALCVLNACGDDDVQPARGVRDAAADTAHQTDAAQHADAGQPALTTLLQTEVDMYDRRVRATCPCLVASGTYATEKECLKYALSGPDWVECAAKALADYDSAATRADSQCYLDYLREGAECAEGAACDQDKLAVCGAPTSDCLAKQNVRINLILAACPDFGLLSRLNTNGDERDD